MAGPLAGIRIVDLTTFTQGGEATGFLCDLGAEITKVETRESGDPGRRLTVVPPGVSTFFLPQNRGKESITLDLATEDGREVLMRLAARSDALMHNFRPGVMERLRIGYEDVRAVNEVIVYGEATGFGSRGPDAGLPAVDIVGEARGGLISVTGEDSPVPPGAIVCDYTGAMHIAIGVLSALLHRERTGRGQKVEGSMLGSAVAMQGWEFTHYLISGDLPGRGGRGHPLFGALWGVFETADGHLAMSGMGPQAWEQFAALIERPDLAADQRFSTPPARAEHGEELAAIVRAAFVSRPTEELFRALSAIGVRCSPVQDYEALAADPQVAANEYVVEVDHPELGPTRMAGNPLRFSETAVEIAASAPALGEHTDAILESLGYGDEERADFRRRGIV